MADDLKALGSIISSAITDICGVCDKSGKAFPALNDPIHPSEFTPQGIRNDPSVVQSINLIVAAASQLLATVRPPAATMTLSAFKYTLPAALGVAEAGNVAETLREAGPNGLHINLIAARSDMHPKKLSRILRYLATEHWFREIKPDVFTNNLLSSLLDSGKKITKDFDPCTKYDNSKGMSALAAYGSDECLKSGSYLVEVMTDPNTKFSEEPNCSALQKALRMTDTFFEYFDRTTEHFRRKRFAIVMTIANKTHTPASILAGFDWATLPDGSIVVDVGGGLGHVALEIAKVYPRLQMVIEDRPLVIEEAKQFWQENLPTHVSNGHVHFIGTDFFEAQPSLPGTVSVFLLRMIIHDWSDKYAVMILRHLRAVAGPSTRLVIIDSILDYVCGSGVEINRVPAPLLPNMGGANVLPYSADLAVFGVLNAGERTIDGFKEILSSSGWKLQEVRRNASSSIFKPAIIAHPV
ncbi:S-adenosyl-L-methionine-dependent methyltransferase [Fomitiporia mediterranea MF3/22]|uniref:S-adenosyl-L-methionine-dependent methyltransferase n=1 Tax=Fomitiporia mediterranea (strain MF3/22) TaxID=694068 RepID=UPI000440773E|nr:S-adenosyl-L-methionine-dependent methyltransferase [Fomitiporia mediterranea MF3/22]EJC99901.1 S-adenosyl-L-methionine-dependent methyltransferase [Fomitiporia mediterranea MF3/22]